MNNHGVTMLATGMENPGSRLAKLRDRAKATCRVTVVVVMDTFPETVQTQGSQRVTEKANKQMAMARDGRKEMLKEKAKERAEHVTIVGRRAISQTVVGKAKGKTKGKASNGVGKAKVLMRLTTVTEKQKLCQKATLVEYG